MIGQMGTPDILELMYSKTVQFDCERGARHPCRAYSYGLLYLHVEYE